MLLPGISCLRIYFTNNVQRQGIVPSLLSESAAQSSRMVILVFQAKPSPNATGDYCEDEQQHSPNATVGMWRLTPSVPLGVWSTSPDGICGSLSQIDCF